MTTERHADETEWSGRCFGIFRAEALDEKPDVIFTGGHAKERATAEMKRRQALPGDDDDDDYLPVQCVVLRCDVSLVFWNSMDEDPTEAP